MWRGWGWVGGRRVEVGLRRGGPSSALTFHRHRWGWSGWRCRRGFIVWLCEWRGDIQSHYRPPSTCRGGSHRCSVHLQTASCFVCSYETFLQLSLFILSSQVRDSTCSGIIFTFCWNMSEHLCVCVTAGLKRARRKIARSCAQFLYHITNLTAE